MKNEPEREQNGRDDLLVPIDVFPFSISQTLSTHLIINTLTRPIIRTDDMLIDFVS